MTMYWPKHVTARWGRQTMKLLVFVVPLFTLDACQNPSRIQAAPSGPFVDSNGPQMARYPGLDVARGRRAGLQVGGKCSARLGAT
jgi:hypothetical protein